MTKFGDWIRLDYAACETTEYRDLANLCALLFEGSQRPIIDRVAGRRRAALDACKEFREKYDHE